MGLFGLFDAAVSAPCGEPRFLRGHATALKIVGEEGEMRCDFAGKVLFRVPVGEAIAELNQYSSQLRHDYGSSASSLSTTPDICRQRSDSSWSAFNPAFVM